MTTTANKLNEIIEDLLLQAQQGVTYKNIRIGLENKGVKKELAMKIVEIVELKHKDFK